MEQAAIIRDAIYSNPLPLQTIKDRDSLKYINSFLPYSTGFEIECEKLNNYNEEEFKEIPDIMDVVTDGSEQRYRIPSGLKGLICLYRISELLQKTSRYTSSGIHYHVDMSDVQPLFVVNAMKILSANEEWITRELDSWEYKGGYNRRGASVHGHYWLRTNFNCNTIEIRIGEMTFDYKVLVKRIIHVNEIAKKLKMYIEYGDSIIYKEKVKSLSEEIKALDIDKTPVSPSEQETTQIIKRRVIRI